MKSTMATILSLFILATPILFAQEPSFENFNHTVGGFVPLPHAMVFEVAMAMKPNSNGEFLVACRTLSLLDDVKVAIRINASDGVLVLEAPKKLRGRARKNKPVDFFVKCKVANEDLASGVNLELRYLFPFEAARDYVEADPHLRYGSKERQEQALGQLAFLEKSGRKVFTVDRAVLLD